MESDFLNYKKYVNRDISSFVYINLIDMMY